MLTYVDYPPATILPLDVLFVVVSYSNYNEIIVQMWLKVHLLTINGHWLSRGFLNKIVYKCSHGWIIHKCAPDHMSLLSMYHVSPFPRTNDGISDNPGRLNNVMSAQWPAEGREIHSITQHSPYQCFTYRVHVAVSTRMRTWARSRRPNASARGGWPTTPVNVCVCGTSTRPLRSWVTCVSCTWRVRSHRPSCWCCTRPSQWSSAWNNKSEVSASLLQAELCRLQVLLSDDPTSEGDAKMGPFLSVKSNE